MLPPDVWRSAMPAGGCREWLSALGLTGTSSVITGAVVAAKVRRHGLAGEHGGGIIVTGGSNLAARTLTAFRQQSPSRP